MDITLVNTLYGLGRDSLLNRMTTYNHLLTDISQGYNIVDILPEEDTVLFGRASQDVKQGYTVIDILEEPDNFMFSVSS